MKHLFLYPLGVFLVVSMACGLLPGSTSPTATPLPPPPATQQPVYQAQPTEVVVPTQELQPTEVVAPTQELQPTKEPQQTLLPTQVPQQEIQPTEVQPTAEPAKPTSFTDEFDLVNQSWTDTVTTTTQAKPGHVYSKIDINDGFLTFDLRDKETYSYRFYKDPMPADVTMELKFYNTAQIMANGVALICRANSDYSSWIEFRVSSQGNYDIFRYDKSLSMQYKNPYIDYKKGIADRNVISPFPTVENDIKASCIGPNLTFILNDKQTITTMKNDILDGGFVGLGAMSGDSIPVTMKIDSFTMASQ
jgi:hypothetical protein